MTFLGEMVCLSGYGRMLENIAFGCFLATFTAELAEIRAKIALLERNDEDNVAAVNDLSEDIHHELETIYEAIAALSIKNREIKRNPIGFKK